MRQNKITSPTETQTMGFGATWPGDNEGGPDVDSISDQTSL